MIKYFCDRCNIEMFWKPPEDRHGNRMLCEGCRERFAYWFKKFMAKEA